MPPRNASRHLCRVRVVLSHCCVGRRVQMSSGTNLMLPRELTYFEKEKIKKDCKGLRAEEL